jgi:hypothetical protein
VDRTALTDPEMREKLAAQGLTIRGSSAQALGAATRTSRSTDYVELVGFALRPGASGGV